MGNYIFGERNINYDKISQTIEEDKQVIIDNVKEKKSVDQEFEAALNRNVSNSQPYYPLDIKSMNSNDFNPGVSEVSQLSNVTVYGDPDPCGLNSSVSGELYSKASCSDGKMVSQEIIKLPSISRRESLIREAASQSAKSALNLEISSKKHSDKIELDLLEQEVSEAIQQAQKELEEDSEGLIGELEDIVSNTTLLKQSPELAKEVVIKKSCVNQEYI